MRLIASRIADAINEGRGTLAKEEEEGEEDALEARVSLESPVAVAEG